MKHLIYISFLLIATIATAQDSTGNTQVASEENNWRLFPNKNNAELPQKDSIEEITRKELNFENQKGSLTIKQPENIDILTENLKNKPYILGYTVQLVVSQQTSKIRDARYRLLKIKPNSQLEETWLPPNTYLYAGSFYSRTDAYLFKKEISSYFPNATVISKKMKLPTLNIDSE